MMVGLRLKKSFAVPQPNVALDCLRDVIETASPKKIMSEKSKFGGDAQ